MAQSLFANIMKASREGEYMIAVITGTTGLVGGLLIKKLLEDSDISSVISVSRKSTQLQHSKLKEVLLQDFAELAKTQEQLHGDIYFCCLGTTIKAAGSQENFRKVDYQSVIDFAKIAKSHDAKHFVVVSAMGANPKSAIFYNRTKGEAEQSLRTLDLNSLTIFRPGLLLGDRKEHRTGEKLMSQAVHLASSIISLDRMKPLVTPAEVLAGHMLSEGKKSSKGVKIIEAKNI